MIFSRSSYRTDENEFMDRLNSVNCTKKVQRLKDLFLSVINKAKSSGFDVTVNAYEGMSDDMIISCSATDCSVFKAVIFDKKSVMLKQKFTEFLDFFRNSAVPLSVDIYECFCNYAISFVCFDGECADKSYFSCELYTEYPHYDGESSCDGFGFHSFGKSVRIYMYNNMQPYYQYRNHCNGRPMSLCSYPLNLKYLFLTLAVMSRGVIALSESNDVDDRYESYDKWNFISQQASDRALFCNTTRFDILDAFLEFYSSDSVVFRDILRDYRNGCCVMPPVGFDSILSSHNKKDIIASKLKKANTMAKDNSLSFAKAYYLHKAEKYTDINCIQKLYDMPDDLIFYALSKSDKEKQRVLNIFTVYYNNFVFKDIVTDSGIIEDYVKMRVMSKQAISLNFRSYKKLVETHDDMALEADEEHVPVIEIPDTVLSQLSLPPEFARITNRRNLVLEGRRQHNCVATYASAINAGRCLIYTTVYDSKRYTIEIQYYDGRFILAQCRGVCNKSAPSELKHKITELLDGESVRVKKIEKNGNLGIDLSA